MAETRHDWINKLGDISPLIKSMNLIKTENDSVYGDAMSKQFNNFIAYKLSSSDAHNVKIVTTLQKLFGLGTPVEKLKKLIVDLTSLTSNTYGTFAEICGYELIAETGLLFDIQVPVTGGEILNTKGSEIDGCFKFGEGILFDIKAFGLIEYTIGELQKKLSEQFPCRFVAINDGADTDIEVITDLLGKGFKSLVVELRNNITTKHGKLEITLRKPNPVQITTGILDPYELAENNANYAFRFAKQFARAKPFILIFVAHPWMGGSRLSTNFHNDTGIFTRSFSRRTFMQFQNDKSDVLGMSKSDASRLISGILFYNACPEAVGSDAVIRLFTNPFAKNMIDNVVIRLLREKLPNLAVDDFRHDKY